jgi:cytochrome o ubiquinol oxidase subunit IV
MNTREPMKFDPKTYFEDIGAWPRSSHRIGVAYITGFILSLLLTLAAYFLATHHSLPYIPLISVIVLLAAIQFIVQMMCFLHLGREAASREKLFILGCVSVVVLILVAGSLWIMNNLNQRMMPSTAQMEQYMNDQTGI